MSVRRAVNPNKGMRERTRGRRTWTRTRVSQASASQARLILGLFGCTRERVGGQGRARPREQHRAASAGHCLVRARDTQRDQRVRQREHVGEAGESGRAERGAGAGAGAGESRTGDIQLRQHTHTHTHTQNRQKDQRGGEKGEVERSGADAGSRQGGRVWGMRSQGRCAFPGQEKTQNARDAGFCG